MTAGSRIRDRARAHHAAHPPLPPPVEVEREVDEEALFKEQQERDRRFRRVRKIDSDWRETVTMKGSALLHPPRRDPKREYPHIYGATPMVEGKKLQTSIASVLTSHEKWEGVFQYNEFDGNEYAVEPPVRLSCEDGELTDEDVTRVQDWFRFEGYLVQEADLWKAIPTVARQKTYHPIREYLDSLPPEGSPGFLDDLATKVYGAALPIENEWLKRFLVSAVRRVRDPGCKVDTMLILKGEQSFKKSESLGVLFGAYFGELAGDLKDKDTAIGLQGLWGVEIPELDSMMRASIELTKAWVPRKEDKLRAAYKRRHKTRKRQCVFAGTTNRGDFLRDDTGERRFLPIEVTRKVDLDQLRVHLDEIWSEANRLEAAGEKHWTEDENTADANEARARFKEVHHWTPKVEEYLAGKTEVSGALEVFLGVIGTEVEKCRQAESRQINTILRNLGCTEGRTTTRRWWNVPERLASLKPPKGKPAAYRAA